MSRASLAALASSTRWRSAAPVSVIFQDRISAAIQEDQT